MFKLALQNLFRRPVRFALTVAGLTIAMAVWAGLAAFGEGYQRLLRRELDQSGMHLMLVPLGCPYDAAARVLKGRTLEQSLPADALATVRADPAVAVAAPMLIAAIARPSERRTDLWVGIDEAAKSVKPWWRVKSGAAWFSGPDSAILGAEAAAIEIRQPGDALHSPEMSTTFRVSGILERSGTSDDSLFFVPLETAQRLLAPGRLTAIAIRLKDPSQLRAVSQRLQTIPGAQVVTLTEMMGTFLNLVGAVRLLLQSITLVALTAGMLGTLNTVLGSVLERVPELCLLRTIGASRVQIFCLVTLETLLLCSLAAALALGLVYVAGPLLETWVRPWIPLVPEGHLLEVGSTLGMRALGLGFATGLLAAAYPAWRASRLAPAGASLAE